MMTLLILTVALTGCNSGSTTTLETEKPAIEQLMKDYFEASQTLDYKTWTGENELQYTTPELSQQLKETFPLYKTSFTEKQLVEKLDSLVIDEISLKTETTGYVVCLVQASGEESGTPFTQKSKYFLEIQKTDGKWLISKYVVQ
ncbi:hypothetical protein AAC978_14065 [Desulfitobacterium sp. THU1]|uniref:hypothetical protein n=1 Tax=Desulfitobacterium sp. THU1 TaxID=3138072 RepID=UPI003120354F